MRGGGGGKEVSFLQLPDEGRECTDPLSSPHSGRCLKVRRKDLRALRVLRGKAEQYPLTAPSPTF